MQRLRKKNIQKEIQLFALHALKRTGHTDGKDDRLTGHKSEKMRNQYKVKPEVVKPAS